MSDHARQEGAAARPSERSVVRWIGLVAGPILGLALFLLVGEREIERGGETLFFGAAGRATLGVMAWMAVWWLTEAIDIAATALLPLAVFPLLGIASMTAAAAPYAHPFIFLFMGGFILALSMQRWGLDRRIALITLRFVGTSPARMIGGFMLVTATLSMWVSNTATAAMMMPIAISVVSLVLKQQGLTPLDEGGDLPPPGVPGRNFALSLMLGIAYAASIGGIGTVIGSPPNVFLVSFVNENLGREVTFLDWMLIGVPIVAVFLPAAWALITWVLYPIRLTGIEGGRDLIEREYRDLGPMKRGEWVTFLVFLGTATLWIVRPVLSDGVRGEAEGAWIVPPIAPGLSDAGIAMIAAMALFVIPVRAKGEGGPLFTMDWPTAARLPWGILILFGGGLSLAAAVEANGVAEFFGAQARHVGDLPGWVVVLIVTAAVIFLTELTSNTATTATLVPILAGLAPGLGLPAELLIFPAAIAASCAFMMPVATPPNAIVFGSGYVTIPQMAKAGLWLNLAGIAIVTIATYALVMPVLGALE